MLLRRQRSIFHLGEEGGAQHVIKSVDDGSIHHHLGGSRNQGRQRRPEQDAAVVGLRILVAQQHRQHARTTPPPSRSSHIVLKQMVLPTSSEARRHRASCGFLRSCTLCRRELSLDKDVYMYRGDQGFCSEECRWQQILIDEAREREALITKQRRGVSTRHHNRPRLAAASPVCGAPRRFLAVA